jgi:hypothetical protein
MLMTQSARGTTERESRGKQELENLASKVFFCVSVWELDTTRCWIRTKGRNQEQNEKAHTREARPRRYETYHVSLNFESLPVP